MPIELPKAMNLAKRVFQIDNEKSFSSIALEVFEFQYLHNSIYRRFCDAIGKSPQNVEKTVEIPFLPIAFFKTEKVVCGEFEPVITFESSGTTGQVNSRHYLVSSEIYIQSFQTIFRKHFGEEKNFCIIGLLPSYLEKGNSSLVYMVHQLIQNSGDPESGFYLYNHEALFSLLKRKEQDHKPVLLFGVTYALLDFATNYPLPLKTTRVIETGGMKGRQKEITRAELYEIFRDAFKISEVYAEYGMTELLSQAYAVNGLFVPPPWMKVLVREETDPFYLNTSGSGAFNIIDLANIYSCSFIETADMGILHEEGSFEVTGRMDFSDIRGCSQLAL